MGRELAELESERVGLGNRCSIQLSCGATATWLHYLTLVYRGRRYSGLGYGQPAHTGVRAAKYPKDT